MNDIKKILLKNREFIYEPNSNDSADILDNCAKNLQDGISIIQFYNKNLSDNDNLKIAKHLRQLVSIYDSLLIINSRADIALLCDADGLCLSKDDIEIKAAKKIFSENKLYGLYCKTLEDAILACENSFDFICINSDISASLISKIRAYNSDIKILTLKGNQNDNNNKN